MKHEDHNPFSENYIADSDVSNKSQELVTLKNDIKVLISRNLDREIELWMNKGFFRLGSAEFVAKGSQSVGAPAREQASLVGATVVVFNTIPAKLKSIIKNEDGSINIPAVIADPPISKSPRGYYVVKAVFLCDKFSIKN